MISNIDSFEEMVATYYLPYPALGDMVVLHKAGVICTFYVADSPVLPGGETWETCFNLLPGPGAQQFQEPVMVLHGRRWCLLGHEAAAPLELPASKARSFEIYFRVPRSRQVVLELDGVEILYDVVSINLDKHHMELRKDTGGAIFKALLVSGRWQIPALSFKQRNHEFPGLADDGRGFEPGILGPGHLGYLAPLGGKPDPLG